MLGRIRGALVLAVAASALLAAAGPPTEPKDAGPKNPTSTTAREAPKLDGLYVVDTVQTVSRFTVPTLDTFSATTLALNSFASAASAAVVNPAVAPALGWRHASNVLRYRHASRDARGSRESRTVTASAFANTLYVASPSYASTDIRTRTVSTSLDSLSLSMYRNPARSTAIGRTAFPLYL